MGLLLGISWLATVAAGSGRVRDLLSDNAGVAALLLAFLAWVGLSMIWSEDHGATATALSRYALNASLFPIVYTALRRRSHALWVAGAFLAGAAIAAAYGIVSPPDVAAASGAGSSAELDRIAGTVGDPNELAAVLVAALVLATALVRASARSPLLRLGVVGAGALCLLTVFLTLSRGGLVALTVAVVAGVVAGGRWRPSYALVGVLAALSAFVYFGAVASAQDRDRLTEADGGTGRTDIWKVGWRMVDARPVTGVGAGNFPVAAVHYALRPGTLRRSDLLVEHPQVTHNVYLQELAELGVIGLALFLAIIAASVGSAVSAAQAFRRTGDSAMELLSRAVAIALCGLLAADFFLSGQYGKQLWLLLALGPALRGLALAGERDGVSPARAA